MSLKLELTFDGAQEGPIRDLVHAVREGGTWEHVLSEAAKMALGLRAPAVNNCDGTCRHVRELEEILNTVQPSE